MLPATNRGAGQTIGMPDVCLTPAPPAPPVPVPYPNLGMTAMAAPFSMNVLVSGMPALHQGSVIPMTSGDEGGLAHPTVKGPARFTTGNPIVKVNNLPAVSLTTPTTGNNMNNGLGAVLVPSVTNVFFTTAEPAAPPLGSLDGRAMGLLGEALDGSEVEHRLEPGGVGVVRIGLFAFATPSRVRAAIVDLSRQAAPRGLERLVIDLRGCPGGDTLAAAELAGDFLPEHSVLLRVLEPDGDERAVLARHAAASPELPLEVWIDGGTASAAEVFAGALQEHGRARLCGSRSRGKATMQRVLPGVVESGASYETVGEARLPSGRSVEGVGLSPDLAPFSAGSR
ncbi:MAG: DUF4150 domain-containing protein [Deltaproteobacteria bacterium]|nr:DUF4150 domain-containing protein [Deltaproteobacteria bacterium]